MLRHRRLAICGRDRERRAAREQVVSAAIADVIVEVGGSRNGRAWRFNGGSAT